MSWPGWYPPILVYHRVDPEPATDTPTLAPEVFEKQMAILSHHFQPIPLGVLVDWLEGKGKLPPRSVAVTFDDAEASVYTHALPILHRYRIPATVFLISANVDQPRSLTRDQIRQMAPGAITFGSHTVNHAYLPSVDLKRAQQELTDSKRSLEAIAGEVDFLSYPGGGFTSEVQRLAAQVGYRAAFTTNRGLRRFPIDRWALRRITMHDSSSTLRMRWICSGYSHLNRRLRAPS